MDQKEKDAIAYREFKTLQLKKSKYRQREIKTKRFVLWPFAVIIPMFIISIILRTLTPSDASEENTQQDISDEIESVKNSIQGIFSAMPHTPPTRIQNTILTDPVQFKADMNAMIAITSPELLFLVDKTHPLPESYIPDDIISLDDSKTSLLLNRNNLQLRDIALSPLITMSNVAKNDGISLLVSSAYRSYAYQKKVFERISNELGEEQASRESARPGTSQHQLGTAIDFGSITPAFANTAAGKWLAENALQYGFSISYVPDGEDITGYIYESWHFRYVGVPAAVMLETYFETYQQYMLEFIYTMPQEGL